jgi:GT2 family glycosyltransferase
MHSSDILVIVPSCGHFDFVYRTLVSLESTRNDELTGLDYIVIDDASPDWETVDWNCFPRPDCRKFHFDTHGGLTRSWNHGLTLARAEGYRYAICANSDLVFSPGSVKHLVSALESDASLVGPLTNAPGHCPWQNVRPFLTGGEEWLIDDSIKSISSISTKLASCTIGPIACPLNGFCLAARTDTWWLGAFDHAAVFNPAFPLNHNEAELQKRWYSLGLKSAMVPQSYVFHYRSVSRTDGLKGRVSEGAFRPVSPSDVKVLKE